MNNFCPRSISDGWAGMHKKLCEQWLVRVSVLLLDILDTHPISRGIDQGEVSAVKTPSIASPAITDRNSSNELQRQLDV
jgi:hypothetical protein